MSRATTDRRVSKATWIPTSFRADASLLTATNVGTPQFMAPELCANIVQVLEKQKNLSQDARGRTHAMQSFAAFREAREHIAYNAQQVDIYAFGCTMYEFLSHLPPFRGLGQSEVMLKVHRGERPTVPANDEVYAPLGWRELMSEAWAQEPHKRPSFTVIAERIGRLVDPVESHRRTNLLRRSTRGSRDGELSDRAGIPLQSLQEPLLSAAHDTSSESGPEIHTHIL